MLCYTSGQIINFYSIEFTVPHFIRNESHKITDTARWLKNIALFKSKIFGNIIASLNYFLRSIESSQCTFTSVCVLIRWQHFNEFLVFICPRRIVFIKRFGNTAPTDIFWKNDLFIGYCKTIIGFTFFQNLDSLHISAKAFFFTYNLNRMCVKIKIVPLLNRNFWMNIPLTIFSILFCILSGNNLFFFCR